MRKYGTTGKFFDMTDFTRANHQHTADQGQYDVEMQLLGIGATALTAA